MTDEQQLVFSRNFGELEVTLAGQMAKPEDRRLGDRLELGDISNLTARNELRARDDRSRMYALANRLWHSDASFRAVGAGYTLLHGRVVPSKGGNTEFADMRAAYDALDDATKAEIEDLVTEHSIVFSREQIGFTDYAEGNADKLRPVRHRLVITHPVTGRKSLYLSSHIGGIVGWPVPEARAFIRDLMEHATQPQFVYAHEWRVNDLVMWDNRTVMHRARRFDDLREVRDLRRTSIKGTGLMVEQAPGAGRGVAAMTISHPPDPSGFVGEVSGIDITRPIARDEVAAIEAGMDRHAVLVFHDQHLTDETQLAFTLNFGELEHTAAAMHHQAAGDAPRSGVRRCRPISTRTTSRWRATTAAGCSISATGCGTRTVRSARSRRSIRCCRDASWWTRAAIPSSPTCAPPMTRWTRRPRPKSKTWSASIR